MLPVNEVVLVYAKTKSRKGSLAPAVVSAPGVAPGEAAPSRDRRDRECGVGVDRSFDLEPLGTAGGGR